MQQCKMTSGPTLTTTAVYLKESGKQDIVNPSDMSKSEVRGCLSVSY